MVTVQAVRNSAVLKTVQKSQVSNRLCIYRNITHLPAACQILFQTEMGFEESKKQYLVKKTAQILLY